MDHQDVLVQANVLRTGRSEFPVRRTENPDPHLKSVIILATGGTIAGSGAAGRANNYTIGDLDAQALVDAVPGIARLANLILVQICNLGSVDVSGEHWLAMTRIINHLAKDSSVAGFVVTHGTDTMEETAYWLNLTVKTEKPVVITGSMRPATAISPDGPMNLYQAVGLAANPESAGRGVMAVFCDGIYAAREVVKVNTLAPFAFDGRDMGRLGYMLNEVPCFYNRSLRRHTVHTEFFTDGLDKLPTVAVAFFCTDADADMLEFLSGRSDGLVVAGTGQGSMSRAWIEKIAALESQGYPVVRASRVCNGPIAYQEKYDRYKNVIRGDNLSPQKARILLQLALTETRDISRITEMFSVY